MRAARVALALGLFAAAASAGWALRRAQLPPDDAPGLERDLVAARADREDAAIELRDAQRRARASGRGVSAPRLDEPAATTSSGDGTVPLSTSETSTWQDRVRDYPRYPFDDATPEVRDALASVDWLAATRSMAGMIPVAEQIAAALEAGETPSAEAIGTSQEHNGPLVTIAMRLHANGVPGSGVNGAFTHPAFLTNAIAATLDAVGRPADEAQLAQLGSIGSDFTQREHARIAGYTDDDPALRRLIDESELKRDFLAAAFGVLTEAQTSALRPSTTRGRIAIDLFSEGLVWVGRAHPLWHRDDAHLAELIETYLLTGSESQPSERVHEIVVAWVTGLPRDVVERTPDALGRIGMIDAGHAVACAAHMLRLVETLLRDGGLGDTAAARLRAFESAPVPFRTASE